MGTPPDDRDPDGGVPHAASDPCAQVSLFEGLDADVWRPIAAVATTRHVEAGATLVEEGDDAGPLFAVLSGALEVVASPDGAGPRSLATVGPGETVGEMALLFETRRAATVRALAPSTVLEMPREAFETALRLHRPLRQRVWALVSSRLPRLRAATLSLLGELDASALDELRGELEWIRIPGGAYLYRAGDAPDGLYVVGSGRLRVVHADGAPRDPSEDDLGPGALVGELALFSEDPREEGLRAVRDTEVVRLQRAAFERVAQAHPSVFAGVMRAMVARTKRVVTHARRGPSGVTSVAILPLTRGVRLAVFAEQLASALRAHGSTLSLSSNRVDALVGPDASQTRDGDRRASWVAEWLAMQERQHAYLVYVGSDAPDAWTERCLRQADHVLVLADGTAELIDGRYDAFLARVAREREGTAPTTELVLLGDRGGPPLEAATWLEGRHFADHHHVSLHAPEDFARLVRFLTGRAVGLVLGGGGARGVAHLGLIAALEAASIPVDVVAGTSIGAVVGATYVLTGSAAEARALCRAELVDARPTRTPALVPLVSLLSASGIERGLARAFGEHRIEDLRRKFLCVAANLTRAEERVFQRGLLWRAVRASLSLPGILPPVLDDGDVLVDGGVLNNLPVDLVRSRCGVVIASAVHGEPELDADPELARIPGASRLLWRRATGDGVRVPSLANVLVSTLGCAGYLRAETARRHADVVFDPPIQGYGMLEFARFDEIVEGAERHAVSLLPAIERVVGRRLSASALIP